MKKIIYLILLSLSACNYPQDGPTNNISQTSAIIDYKNGLMFFDTKGAEFGTALSNFISGNPDLEVVDIEQAGKGYWVIVRKK